MKNKPQYKIILMILSIGLILALVAGCSASAPQASASESAQATASGAQASASQTGLKKTLISYAGGTCEAPTFVAYQKGFFKDEGLDVELIQTSFDQLKQGLDAGSIDAAQANFAWFKPIEQGLNIKMTGGIHEGCISAVTPADSGIKTVADLKGKAIGVDAIGGGPQIALSTKLREAGIDPITEVEWKAYPGAQIDEAINKGEIQAYITWDPFPAQAVKDKGYINLLDIGKDDPFNQNYCCFVGVSGNVVANDPDKATAITRAFLKAAEWVGQNPEEAAKISVDGKYIGGDVALNAELLGSYTWNPSIKQAEASAKFFIKEQKAQGILEAGTNEDDLYKAVFTEVIPDYNGK